MNWQAPPDWHPDPFGRFQLRYWDGVRWTEHVAASGLQTTDPPVPAVPEEATPSFEPIRADLERRASSPAGGRGSRRIQRQVRRAGAETAALSGGSIYTEPVLVVNQKAKLIGGSAEYAVHNQHGQQIGTVREIGRSVLGNAFSVRSNSNRLVRLKVLDHSGMEVMTLTRPAKFGKSTVILRGMNGVELGRIVQKKSGFFGKVRFDFESRSDVVGSLIAESWGTWDFRIEDGSGDEVARISRDRRRDWAGQTKRTSTKRDKYVVEIHRPLDEPLHSLVIASALTVDTVLRQDHQ